ncbi:Pseudaminic acid biosynthesis-associated protein PseG [Desulfitobacterium hafniense]|uniref:Pseudaminic acid biosynthesis-associated protein PseG n=1 Tax=Desulfitobacterium hafniense TaxID=49338 RepID=A0A098B428_DESHA|nr:UDP-2,4-diacetamido-2,4,6-trideoxy-beta-L-altropyranose hydrolase [Desulfitobacterium hafniense]CDX03135.1 Pseudaminic acid biosynthesis-associated protein PseG [Desulfitobacterium hafniense]
MNVVIRADSSNIIGTGHVMRCLALAKELEEANTNINFICRESQGNLSKWIKKNGFGVFGIPVSNDERMNLVFEQDFDSCETISIIKKMEKTIDWLIVDHYDIDIGWERILRPYAKNIMVIDDLANRVHDCAVILDQNLFFNMSERYDALVSNDCVRLLGPQYALLRKEFRSSRLRHPRRLASRSGQIMISFGGSDPGNDTLKVLEAVEGLALQNVAIKVVIGGANPNKAEIMKKCAEMDYVKYYFQVDDMSELMEESDLFIGGGGSTVWERCCIGLPGIVIPIAYNQVNPMKELAKAGIIHLYEGEKSVRGYMDEIEFAMSNLTYLNDLAIKGMKIYDGAGTIRVSKCMRRICREYSSTLS